MAGGGAALRLVRRRGGGAETAGDGGGDLEAKLRSWLPWLQRPSRRRTQRRGEEEAWRRRGRSGPGGPRMGFAGPRWLGDGEGHVAAQEWMGHGGERVRSDPDVSGGGEG